MMSYFNYNLTYVSPREKLDESVWPVFYAFSDGLLHVDLSFFQPLGHFRQPVAFLVGQPGSADETLNSLGSVNHFHGPERGRFW